MGGVSKYAPLILDLRLFQQNFLILQVTLLVYRDGDHLNFFRVVDRGDGTLTPFSESLRFVDIALVLGGHIFLYIDICFVLSCSWCDFITNDVTAL